MVCLSNPLLTKFCVFLDLRIGLLISGVLQLIYNAVLCFWSFKYGPEDKVEKYAFRRKHIPHFYWYCGIFYACFCFIPVVFVIGLLVKWTRVRLVVLRIWIVNTIMASMTLMLVASIRMSMGKGLYLFDFWNGYISGVIQVYMVTAGMSYVYKLEAQRRQELGLPPQRRHKYTKDDTNWWQRTVWMAKWL